jgi:transposase
MTNQITMGTREAIISLYRSGVKKRRIARRLGIDIKTVRGYLKSVDSISPISPPGSEAPTSPISPAGKPFDEAQGRAGRPSTCAPFSSQIEEAVRQGLCGQRIYQDLKTDCGFTGSYDAVKRFLRRLIPAAERIWRMETQPGEEAQVDFGKGARIRSVDGKTRGSWVFRIVLSFSRKAYSEAVFHQCTEVFIRCLENAFRALGGVPATVVIDNLKAAVKHADWYDPELIPKIMEFARHYGTVILPTRARTPEHKGKIENSVKYVKANALKGREFQSLSEENRFLDHWERSVADLRIHGTTRRQVVALFTEEKPALKPLPASLFPCFQEGKRRVHRDSYVEVAKAYYKIPEEYVGRDVWIRWDSHLVRIFNTQFQQICVLARQGPGQFSECLGAQGRPGPVEQSVEYWRERAMKLGEHCGLWADRILEQRGPWGIRVLQGLVGMTRKHPVRVIEEACRQALTLQCYRLRELKALVRQPEEQLQIEFLQVHPLIRDLSEYEVIFKRMASNN